MAPLGVGHITIATFDDDADPHGLVFEKTCLTSPFEVSLEGLLLFRVRSGFAHAMAVRSPELEAFRVGFKRARMPILHVTLGRSARWDDPDPRWRELMGSRHVVDHVVLSYDNGRSRKFRLCRF